MGHESEPQTWREQLADQRRSIDNLDRALIAILAERFRLTEKIGRAKAAHRIDATDAEREAEQFEQFRQLASHHELDEEIAVGVMTYIIDHVKRRHDVLQREE